MKYILLEPLGKGSFGNIFLACNERTREKVAIKTEPVSSEIKTLKYEMQIYQVVGGLPGFLKVKWFGMYNELYYLVLPLMGKSLGQCSLFFSLEQINEIGIKIIKILQTFHENGFIHRDVKPDNFLFDISFEHLYIIDFGIAKQYKNQKEERILENFIGCWDYASLRACSLIEQSRRDDLESISFILDFLKTGEKPFKEKTSLYLEYCRNLSFTETPNYNILYKTI